MTTSLPRIPSVGSLFLPSASPPLDAFIANRIYAKSGECIQHVRTPVWRYILFLDYREILLEIQKKVIPTIPGFVSESSYEGIVMRVSSEYLSASYISKVCNIEFTYQSYLLKDKTKAYIDNSTIEVKLSSLMVFTYRYYVTLLILSLIHVGAYSGVKYIVEQKGNFVTPHELNLARYICFECEKNSISKVLIDEMMLLSSSDALKTIAIALYLSQSYYNFTAVPACFGYNSSIMCSTNNIRMPSFILSNIMYSLYDETFTGFNNLKVMQQYALDCKFLFNTTSENSGQSTSEYILHRCMYAITDQSLLFTYPSVNRFCSKSHYKGSVDDQIKKVCKVNPDARRYKHIEEKLRGIIDSKPLINWSFLKQVHQMDKKNVCRMLNQNENCEEQYKILTTQLQDFHSDCLSSAETMLKYDAFCKRVYDMAFQKFYHDLNLKNSHPFISIHAQFADKIILPLIRGGQELRLDFNFFSRDNISKQLLPLPEIPVYIRNTTMPFLNEISKLEKNEPNATNILFFMARVIRNGFYTFMQNFFTTDLMTNKSILDRVKAEFSQDTKLDENISLRALDLYFQIIANFDPFGFRSLYVQLQELDPLVFDSSNVTKLTLYHFGYYTLKAPRLINLPQKLSSINSELCHFKTQLLGWKEKHEGKKDESSQLGRDFLDNGECGSNRKTVNDMHQRFEEDELQRKKKENDKNIREKCTQLIDSKKSYKEITDLVSFCGEKVKLQGAGEEAWNEFGIRSQNKLSEICNSITNETLESIRAKNLSSSDQVSAFETELKSKMSEYECQGLQDSIRSAILNKYIDVCRNAPVQFNTQEDADFLDADLSLKDNFSNLLKRKVGSNVCTSSYKYLEEAQEKNFCESKLPQKYMEKKIENVKKIHKDESFNSFCNRLRDTDICPESVNITDSVKQKICSMFLDNKFQALSDTLNTLDDVNKLLKTENWIPPLQNELLTCDSQKISSKNKDIFIESVQSRNLFSQLSAELFKIVNIVYKSDTTSIVSYEVLESYSKSEYPNVKKLALSLFQSLKLNENARKGMSEQQLSLSKRIMSNLQSFVTECNKYLDTQTPETIKLKCLIMFARIILIPTFQNPPKWEDIKLGIDVSSISNTSTGKLEFLYIQFLLQTLIGRNIDFPTEKSFIEKIKSVSGIARLQSYAKYITLIYNVYQENKNRKRDVLEGMSRMKTSTSIDELKSIYQIIKNMDKGDQERVKLIQEWRSLMIDHMKRLENPSFLDGKLALQNFRIIEDLTGILQSIVQWDQQQLRPIFEDKLNAYVQAFIRHVRTMSFANMEDNMPSMELLALQLQKNGIMGADEAIRAVEQRKMEIWTEVYKKIQQMTFAEYCTNLQQLSFFMLSDPEYRKAFNSRVVELFKDEIRLAPTDQWAQVEKVYLNECGSSVHPELRNALRTALSEESEVREFEVVKSKIRGLRNSGSKFQKDVQQIYSQHFNKLNKSQQDQLPFLIQKLNFESNEERGILGDLSSKFKEVKGAIDMRYFYLGIIALSFWVWVIYTFLFKNRADDSRRRRRLQSYSTSYSVR